MNYDELISSANQAITISSSIAIFLAILCFYLLFDIDRIRKRHKGELEIARQTAIKQSKTTIRAQVSEEVLPLFSEFPYNIGDLKLFGKPIDYVCFEGMNEFRDGNKEKEITIIFADVKTGKAVKSPVQRAIKNAIDNGRIRFEEWRIDENNKLKIK